MKVEQFTENRISLNNNNIKSKWVTAEQIGHTRTNTYRTYL